MSGDTSSYEFAGVTITLLQGDITLQNTNAIVNAANTTLLGGGGVDGAIHRAGGPEILDECRRIVRKIGRCPTGEAVITTGGNLPAAHVIHTVGPVYKNGRHGEPAKLANAYRNSLRLAIDNKLRSIAFPSISTGAYRYPIEQAAAIALRTVTKTLEKQNVIKEVRFVLFSALDLKVYRKTIADILGR